ncbi:hypothetical protein GCM10025881_15750 [Pseudolysinimonas kribbensis]|uniref:Core-binding (CB) domain-containing protein n=1 Tax=Pseudolysinimonas kribbensis TaxID=433641 RepID=A0ABQ6K2B8_9MICO|nr:hypothetical protein GCM10025881_15750 [Pseudolysinimonas kribbensis]
MATIEPYDTNGGRRYRVRYRKPDNSQTDKRGFKTKREAELFLAEIAIGRSAGTFIDPALARATIATVGDAWLASRSGLKPSSLAVMESAWRLHVRPHWGSVQIGKVRRSDIEAWVVELRRPDRGRPLSPATIHRCHGILSAVLEAAVRDRKISNNPARGSGCRLVSAGNTITFPTRRFSGSPLNRDRGER